MSDNHNPVGLEKDDFETSTTEKNKGGKKTKVGAVTAKKGTYNKYRPDTFTKKTEKEVDNYRKDYVTSVVTVGGEIALEKYLKKEGDTAVVVSSMLTASDKVTTTVSHSSSGVIQLGGRKGEKYKNYGTTRVVVATTFGRGKGTIGKARQALRDKAKKKLDK